MKDSLPTSQIGMIVETYGPVTLSTKDETRLLECALTFSSLLRQIDCLESSQEKLLEADLQVDVSLLSRTGKGKRLLIRISEGRIRTNTGD